MITGGVLGIASKGDCSSEIYNYLFRLQHRGQEYVGISTFGPERLKEEQLKLRTHRGLVRQTFADDLVGLEGTSGIGHVSSKDRQPISQYARFGQFVVGFDGYIMNADKLRNRLFSRGHSFSTLEDIELLAKLITIEKTIEKGLINVLAETKGACSIIVLTQDGTIFAARDKLGIKPLTLGHNSQAQAVASESCGFTPGMKIIRDLKPGEIVRLDGNDFSTVAELGESMQFCSFEHTYYANPSSVIEGRSVVDARHAFGGFLAEDDNIEADVVGCVPFSGYLHAEGYHLRSGLPFVEIFLLPQYSQKTYIKPLVARKEEKARKLVALETNIRGKRLVVVDDSIRSGITMKGLVDLLRAAGAKEVHIRIASPPSKRFCPLERPPLDEEDFVARNHSTEQIRKMIGATTLRFQKLENVPKALNMPSKDLCMACYYKK